MTAFNSFSATEAELDVKQQEVDAREGVVHDLDLVRMNKLYAVVKVGGKTRVVSFEESDTHPGSKVPVFSTIPDFCAFHSKQKKEVIGIGGNPKRVGIGKWWIDHEERRQYDGIVYAPGAEVGDRLNLWKGFACQPKAGKCDLYLKHIRENICGGNEEYAAYLIGWMAYAVQNSGKPGEVAIVLRGREGTGKGVFAKQFGGLFGAHFKHISHANHLTGHFNAHLQHCSVLFADEAFFAGDRSHESVLKALITEDTILIEPKGIDSYSVRNCVHLIMASNSQWVVPAGADARRYFVLDVSDARMQDQDYFAAIATQMENGGRAALLDYLQNLELFDFNLRKIPNTQALADQKTRSRRGIDRLVERLAEEGTLPSSHAVNCNVAITTGEERGEGFYWQARKLVPELKHESTIVISKTLKREWSCTGWKSGNQRGLEFPPLTELRALFDRKHGPQEWQTDVSEWAHS